MSNYGLWDGIGLRVLLQDGVKEALGFGVNRLAHDWVDAFGTLVMEGRAGAKLISIDLLECGNSRGQHLLIVVVHRHRVVRQVDRGQIQALKVLLVLFCVLQIVPVDPEILKVGEMI